MFKIFYIMYDDYDYCSTEINTAAVDAASTDSSTEDPFLTPISTGRLSPITVNFHKQSFISIF